MMLKSLLLLLSLLALAATASAATLKDYESRVRGAQARVDAQFRSQGEGMRPTQIGDLNSIRILLPREESVEWPGGTVTVSNQWLHGDLDRLLAEADREKQINILAGINERLLAITASLSEISVATREAAPEGSDKQKIGEILSRPEYQKAPVPEESLFQRWARQIEEWLEQVYPKTPDVSTGGSSALGGIKLWLQILIYVSVLGLVVFLLYRFIPFFSARFARREKGAREDRVILGERVSATESAEDLFAEADKLARDGNLRAAVRKGYIALLCELDDRKAIRLARHKSNRDYLSDLRRRSDLFADVAMLTGQFERSWYGYQAAEPEDWEAFRITYHRALAEAK